MAVHGRPARQNGPKVTSPRWASAPAIFQGESTIRRSRAETQNMARIATAQDPHNNRYEILVDSPWRPRRFPTTDCTGPESTPTRTASPGVVDSSLSFERDSTIARPARAARSPSLSWASGQPKKATTWTVSVWPFRSIKPRRVDDGPHLRRALCHGGGWMRGLKYPVDKIVCSEPAWHLERNS